MARRIIIDTDPGQDDAVAILTALASPDETASAAVREGITTFLGRRPGVVAAYVPLPGEVDLAGLLDIGADVIALPCMEPDGTVSWRRDEGRRQRNRLGFGQPSADLPVVDPVDFDLLLVPGRLFDHHGIRLGRGGGHYDRLLPRLRPGAAVVGVTVDERIVPRLPTDQHDRPMTHLATQSGVRAVSGFRT